MITCPNCQTDNRDEAKFCKHCGTQQAEVVDKMLQDVVGKKNILHQLSEITAIYNLYKQNNPSKQRPAMNMLILGSSGTGKTYLANVIQNLFFSKSMVTNPKIIRVDAPDFDDWIANFTEEELRKCFGSILFIDNVHFLMNETAATTSIDKLTSLMEDWETDTSADWNKYPIVIFAGEKNSVEAYFQAKKNGRNRFEYTFTLNDCTAEELKELCIKQLSKYHLSVSPDVGLKLLAYFKYLIKNRKIEFRNAFEAIAKANEIYRNSLKKGETKTVSPECITGNVFIEQSPSEILAKLDSFVGIEDIKKEVHAIVENIKQYRIEKNDPAAIPLFKDQYIFLGNPGTGKTSVARVFADILNALGILPNGQLIEVTREDLVAEFIGQTGPKTMSVVESAMGGVLFVDEAYTLSGGGNTDFGKEAINALLKPVEEKRGQFVCILAGYTAEMQDFFNSNSGITSRFNKVFEFKDYKPEELNQIFLNNVKKDGYTLDIDAQEHTLAFFEKMYNTRTKNFGNARNVINAYNQAIERQRERLSQQKLPASRTLTRADIEGSDAMKELDVEKIMKSLDNDFVGMQHVKKFIGELAVQKADMDKRLSLGIAKQQTIKLNILLTGNPGTGKTSVARKLGEIFRAMNILPSDGVVERQRKDIVGKYTNSAGEEMSKACDLAMGRVLFIDEAYSFAPVNDAGTKDEEALKAIEVLMKRMEDDAGKFAVVLAGYPAPMDNFVRANEGIERRITHRIHIDDYSTVELVRIFQQMAVRQGYLLAEEVEAQLFKKVEEMLQSKSNSWGNAGEMAKLLEAVKTRMAGRIRNLPEKQFSKEQYKKMLLTICKEDIPFEMPKTLDIQSATRELNTLVGLKNIKTHISQLIASFKMEEARGENTKRKAPHYIFSGNPGTGKTTVAKLMADILTSLGVLSRGHLVQVTEKDLIAGYSGQTAIKTSNVIDSALGGILFIDEAYSLNKGNAMSGGNFGQEAINTLVERLSRDEGKFVCILAGYKQAMEQFLETNVGLQERFRGKIEFEDYTSGELEEIFRNLLKKDNIKIDDYTEKHLSSFFEKLYESRDAANFGNARAVVNIYKQAREKQDARLLPLYNTGVCSKEELYTLTWQDISGNEGCADITPDELIKEFDELVGRKKPKEKMSLILRQIELNRKRAEITDKLFVNLNANLAFIGNPATGKKEFANVMAKVFRTIGIIEKQIVIEINLEKIAFAYDYEKVFHDEFNAASDGICYVQNPSSILKSQQKKEIEDLLISKIREEKGKTVFIFDATGQEWESFSKDCSRLALYIKDHFTFEDYNADELTELFISFIHKNGMQITDQAKMILPEYFGQHNGNGFGEVEFLYDSAIYKLNERFANVKNYTPEMLTIIDAEDLLPQKR